MIHVWTMDRASTLRMATTVPVLQNLLELIVKVKIIIIIFFLTSEFDRMKYTFRCKKTFISL